MIAAPSSPAAPVATCRRAEAGHDDYPADQKRSAGRTGVGDQAPDAQELASRLGRRQISAEGLHDATAEAVAEAAQQTNREQRREGLGRWQQRDRTTEDQQARHSRPLSPVAIHQDADRIEHEHIDARGQPEDQADLRLVQPDLIAPERDQQLPAHAQQLQNEHRRSGCGEHGTMLTKQPADATVDAEFADERRGRRPAWHDDEEHHRGRKAECSLCVERRLEAEHQGEHPAEDRANEVADAVGAADEGECAAPSSDRQLVCDVGETRDVPQ